MPSDIMKIPVPQDVETAISRLQYRNLWVRYTYARSNDSQVTNQLGQDYLEFWLGESESKRLKFVFSVCDGVGSSFMGHVAAQMLGQFLCEKMWGKEIAFPPPRNSDHFVHRLTKHLDEFISESHQAILQYPLPENLPGLTRRALDEQREYGSEAMFVCGMLLSDYLILAWLGDARLQVLTEDFQPIDDFVQIPNTNHRWSSKVGMRGEIQAHVIVPEQLPQVKHILAFSDGLSTVADQLASVSDSRIDAIVNELGRMPTSDDIALVHFEF